ncbi:hypothetical protein FGE12_11110 [Aggregicoccus sp. 17bor-14]|uniref:hypothetical protein n=1 Tax=Myxococcaceae TaxID=31 RepID=UPI00129CE7FC|nr:MULTISPECIES: hypothetical protein [Myxococcaceae]MBF5042938.1 hypothetical protein [Simulacricoccus sp. 17bor-14]MRI88704.1 hypothetical protein [Aggregicoccus sp. 17bor-14]
MRAFPLAAVLAVSLLSASQASATNYTLWIHGRNGGSTQAGNYADFSYWGPASTAAGVNKKAVNWDGRQRIGGQNYRIRDALDCFCTGSNWCYIAAHSAGDLQIGYALSLYGTSARYKKNAVPNSSGVCGNTDGTTQTGWNIKWVDVASGAGGGSELADSGSWATSDPLVTDLKTTNARALYNHNATTSKWFYMFAGAKGTAYSGILPGQDDEAVAYHSTGGVSGSSGGSYCNPSDWLCNDLTLGTNACEGGAAKWSFHTVDFRDDNEAYNHYANGNWEGIVSKVRADAAAYAL